MKKRFAFLLCVFLLSALAGGGGLFLAADEASAEVKLSREIRYIIPYEPGGLSDITARTMERIIRQQDLLSVPFTVTNIPGASAANGMVAVRDAKPDGHTLLHHHTSFITHKSFGVRDWAYEVYEPVALLFEVPCVLFTKTGKYETLEEWVDDVKANPGKTSFATSSLGGNAHLFAEQIMNELGIRDMVNLAAYGAGGPMFTAMLGGEDNISSAPLPQAMDHHKSGDMFILAVGSDERLPFLPEVPTLKELGIEIPMSVAYRMGVWAPKNTPKEIVDYWYGLLEKVISSEEFAKSSEGLGVFPKIRDGNYLFEIFESDTKTIDDLVEKLELNK